MFGHFGVHYIVVEPNFWNDLESMQMLQRVLHEDQFKLLTKISAVNNREHNDSQLEIYENLAPVAQRQRIP